MTLFDGFPSYPRFRPLSDQSPRLVGEDVYALQTMLAGLGHTPGPHDGILGPATGKAIWGFQITQGLFKDGVAGPATNNRGIEILSGSQSRQHGLPDGLLFGQLAWESSLYPGQYSPARSDGSYDAGVAQLNTAHYPAAKGFDTPYSTAFLATNLQQYHAKFAGVGGRRQWMLAAGAHNAPAYACWIAKQEGASGVRTRETKQPGPTARAKLEQYMVASTVLMR